MSPRYRVHQDVLLTELQDGTGVLLDLRTNFYFSLNRSGLLVWKAITRDGMDDEETLLDLLDQSFSGLKRDEAREHLNELLSELTRERLLEPLGK